MWRAVKVVVLIFSHAALFVVGAVALVGYRTEAEFEAAAGDPLYRVGAAMTQSRTDETATAALEADLPSLSSRLRAPTADVIRLVALLQQDRLDDARIACGALAWPHCDLQTLADMRKAAAP
jgi:hypothetical protein